MSPGAITKAGGAALGALLVLAALAITAPLAVYTVSLAAFGLPHVLSELRYVDLRFGRRLEARFLWSIALLLPLIVAIRACTVFHLISSQLGVPAELGGVALLALSCARGPRRQVALALAVALTLGWATLTAPFVTAVVLSILHNLTPLGFFRQIAPLNRRGAMMGWALADLLGLPLLIATGWPRAGLSHVMASATALDPLKAGRLADNLFVYVPPDLTHSIHAIDLFTASVVAQGAHYASVIVLLPLLRGRLDPDAHGLLRWPKGAAFAVLCVAAGGISLAVFYGGFSQARGVYGLAASVHAWLEIPVLILALSGAGQPSHKPTSIEPELAARDTSRA